MGKLGALGVAAAATLAAVLAGGSAAYAADSDEAAILAVEHGIAAAKNADQLMYYYAPGPQTVLYDSITPGAFYGSSAIRDDFAKQFAGVKSVKVDILKISTGASGSLGYAYSTQHAVMNNTDGTQLEVTFRQTDILQKDAQGRWKVIHQQISYPVDMATGKAAFNLPQ